MRAQKKKKKTTPNKTNKNKADTQIPMGHPSQEVTVCPQCLRLFYSLEFWFSNVFSPCSLITHYNRKILVPLETLGVLWGVRMLHSLADSIFVPDIPDDFFVLDRILHIPGSPQILYVIETSLQILILPPLPPEC